MDAITTFVDIFVFVMYIAIFARVVLSWFPTSSNNPLVAIVYQITEPILGPLRRVIPRLGFFDLTPMIAIIVLIAIQSAVHKVL